jgi:hypothetical protein
MSIVFRAGDATNYRGNTLRVLVHIVNDKTPNWGGGGFAVQLSERFPSVATSFRAWWRRTPKARLGRVHFCEVAPRIVVASVIAQRGYGPSKKPRIRYDALKQGLGVVARYSTTHNATLQMPRIGCGLAGGSWPVIRGIVHETLVDKGVRVLVYDLPRKM